MGFAGIGRGGAKELFGAVIYTLLTAWLLFGIAHRTDLPCAWVYVALVAAWSFGHTLTLAVVDPALLDARGTRPKAMRGWDLALTSLFGLAWPFGIPAVAGLDLRDGPDLGAVPCAIGAVLHLAGSALFTWALAVNPFFEKTARIQADRGQVVCEAGPYARLRHPGYLASLLHCAAAPLVLGSWASALPAAIAAAAMVARTALEDRMLRHELPGYAEYALRVRWRLIPGLW